MAQALQTAVVGIPIIYLGKLLHKLLQIGVWSNHKGGNRYVAPSALRGQIKGFIHYFGI